MERGRKNKSPFKLGAASVLGATGGLTGMNRGRGITRGRPRVTRDPNIYNPGRPANPTGQQQQFSPEQMQAFQEMVQNMRENVTQVNARPQPQNIQQFGQVGMMGAGGSGNSMYDRAVAVRDRLRNRPGFFRGKGQGLQTSRPMERFNQMTGRNNFPTMGQAAQQMMPNRNFATNPKRGIFGMPSQLPSGRMNPMYSGIGGALAFKRKPSGFKMKKK